MVPVGFGKTVCSLTAVKELMEEGTFKRLLVVAPLRVCQLTWATEYKLWEHLADMKIGIATGNAEQRANTITSPHYNIVVVNFDNVKWVLDNYGDTFDALLIDELTKLKGGGVSLKSIRQHTKNYNWVAGMTGTLVEEGMDTLYYQYMAIDSGATFGRRRDTFLNEYFTPDYNGFKWTPKEGTFKRLADKIRPITYSAETYEDLEEAMIEVVYVEMGNHTREVYNTMKKDMIVQMERLGEPITAANSAVLSGKLQQICSGFLYTESEGSRFIHDKKMYLLSFLAKKCRTAKQPVLIVYTFKWELDYLFKHLEGAVIFTDAPERNEQNWNEGKIPYLLIHPLSAGHGLNLQRGGHRVIFTGPIWSRDQTDQVIGRLNRRGQTKKVHATFLVTRNSVEDIVMMPRVLGKKDTAQEFRRHLMEGV